MVENDSWDKMPLSKAPSWGRLDCELVGGVKWVIATAPWGEY